MASSRAGFSSAEGCLAELMVKSKTKSVIQLVYGLEDINGVVPESAIPKDYPSGIFLNKKAEKKQAIIALSAEDDEGFKNLEVLFMSLVSEEAKKS